MLYILMVVIIQAVITIAILLFLVQNRKSFHNMLLLYILTVVLDMGYEYFIIKRFGYESVLYEIPGSLRVFKGLIFLHITLHFIDFKWRRDKLKYLVFPFGFIILFHTLALSAKLFGYQQADTFIYFYKTYLVNYYFNYWCASLIICIFLLHRYQNKIKNPLFKQFRLFLYFILIGVVAFWCSFKFGIDILVFQKIYSLLFLVQFAWILYVYILSYQEQLKNNIQLPTIEVSVKEKYQYKDLSKINFEKIQESIENFYQNSTLYLDENFTLENLAQDLSVSRTDLTITFNQYLTSNFHEYTNRNRVLQFMRMHKEEPGANVTDLAFQCGFKSKSTFYKYFKKEFNCLPTGSTRYR